MKARRISDVVERVVAWHNRHPLARRIGKSQVQGVGVVALPFALKRRPGERTGRRVEPAWPADVDLDPSAVAAEPHSAPAPPAPPVPDLGDGARPDAPPVLSDRVDVGTDGHGHANPATGPTPDGASLPAWRRLLKRWIPRRGAAGQHGKSDTGSALTPIFGEEWMFRLPPARLGRWVRRHGVYPLEGFGHWPLRQVDADIPLARRADARGLEGRTVRHLLTAVLDVDGRRVRVLIAPGVPLEKAPVFGRRVWSPPRAGGLAAAGLSLGLGAALGLGAWTGHGSPEDAAMAHAGSAASAASASASSASGHPTVLAEAGHALPSALSASAPGSASGSVSGAASAAVPGAEATVSQPSPTPSSAHPTEHVAAAAAPASTAPAAGPPADVKPSVQARREGAAPLARIRPSLTEDERRQARLQAEALRPETAAALPAAQAAALSGNGPVYALVTPLARTRDDAIAQQVLLQGLKAQTSTPVPTQLDVMPSQGRWRVVWWPHPQQQEAEALLREARARGLKVELIAF